MKWKPKRGDYLAIRTNFIALESVSYRLLPDGVFKDTEYDDKIDVTTKRNGIFGRTKIIEQNIKVPKIVEHPKYKHDEEALAKMHLDAQMHFKREFTERGFKESSIFMRFAESYSDRRCYTYRLVDTLNRWYERNHITADNIISVQIESHGAWVTWDD